MKAKLIKSEHEYQAALQRIEELFDIQPGSEKFEEAELLVVLIDLYEQEQFRIDAPDPIEAIKFRLEQMNMNRNELIPYLGTKSRVSEILNRKRKLTVQMMRSLHKEFGIPANSLLA